VDGERADRVVEPDPLDDPDQHPRPGLDEAGRSPLEAAAAIVGRDPELAALDRLLADGDDASFSESTALRAALCRKRPGCSS